MNTPRETRRLDELAQDIAPARDLWPSIAREIRPGRTRAPWMPWALAAGLAFVASGLWWSQRGGDATPPELAAIGDPVIEAERQRLAGELSGVLDALPVDARFGAKQSLDAVRSARSQIVAALRRDGDDPALHEWLRDNQQQEVRVLRAIVDAGNRTRTL